MKTRKFIFAFLIYFCLCGVIIWSSWSIFLAPVINENIDVFSNFSWSLEEPLGDQNRIDPYMKAKWLTLQWKSSVEDEQLPKTYNESNRDIVYMYPFDHWRFAKSINSEEISDYNNYFTSYEKSKTLCSLNILESKNFITSFIVNEPNRKQPIETVKELKQLFEVMFPRKLSYEVALGVVLDQNNRVIEIIHFANGDDKTTNFCLFDFQNAWAVKQPAYKDQLLKIIAIHNHPNSKQVKGEAHQIGISYYSEKDYKFVKHSIELYNLQKNNLSNRFILVNNLIYAESDKGLAGPKNDLTQPLTEEVVNKWYVTQKSNEIYNDLNKSFELIKKTQVHKTT